MDCYSSPQMEFCTLTRREKRRFLFLPMTILYFLTLMMKIDGTLNDNGVYVTSYKVTLMLVDSD